MDINLKSTETVQFAQSSAIKTISIHNKEYTVLETEFCEKEEYNNEFFPLKIKQEVSDYDREIGFLKDVANWLDEYDEKIDDESIKIIETVEPILVDLITTHGGYVVKNLKDYYKEIHYFTMQENVQNCLKNTSTVKQLKSPHFLPGDYVVRCEFDNLIDMRNISARSYNSSRIIVAICSGYSGYMKDEYEELLWELPYTHVKRKILILKECFPSFKEKFGGYIYGSEFVYDNLLNLLIMVKNAGDDDKFYHMIKSNLSFCNKFCILDTGSTDNTMNNIKNATKELSKLGSIHRESFINFRDSRNRLFRLAGEECTFNVMLDDTYYLRVSLCDTRNSVSQSDTRNNNSLHNFLHLVRGDDFAQSYAVSIISYDQKYGSTRFTKSFLNPEYKYIIHEVVETQNSVSIPESVCIIYDEPSMYMKIRTAKRKEDDLRLLFKELEDNPSEVRQLYYIAETYLCIGTASESNSLHYFKLAKKYYDIRASHNSGYYEEIYDSLLKSAFLYQSNYDYFGPECNFVHPIKMYEKCVNYDPNRYDGYFLMGYSLINSTNNHYIYDDNMHTAFLYLKKALSIGLPSASKYNMNIKLEQFLHHLPNFLMELCYFEKDFTLGEKCAQMILDYNLTPLKDSEKNRAQMMKCMYAMLNQNFPLRGMKKVDYINNKHLLVFMIDGGWKSWDGRTIETDGLGGSETCIINYTETINQNVNSPFYAIVFCKCNSRVVYNNVEYIPMHEFSQFISTYKIHTCFVNRYTELAPVVMENNIRTIIMLHDLCREEEFIPNDKRLKKVLCLSDFHVNSVVKKFPYLQDRLSKFSYGLKPIEDINISTKIPNSFIYSSFPTRGLFQLLNVFPKIAEVFPNASLNIFCDLDHEWSNSVAPDLMNTIKKELNNLINKGFHVKNHGWVSKKVLNSYWEKTEYWLYLPTHFEETFCLTALEAFQHKTCAMYINTGSLGEVIGDRGVMLNYDRENCVLLVNEIFDLMKDNKRKTDLIEKAFEYVQTQKNLNCVVEQFIERFVEN